MKTVNTDFCVYIHSKPTGEPFYVGKGKVARAYEFSPSRRTRHYNNIIAKYGRDNIGICLIPCESEDHASLMEIQWIKRMRLFGFNLTNLTDGGEGVTGRKPTVKQLAGLAKGRGKERWQALSPEVQQAILEGLRKGREKSKPWLKSAKTKQHLEKLSKIGAKVLHREHSVVCAECGKPFLTCSAKAQCCSRLCEQRHRRKRQALNAPPKPRYRHLEESRNKMSRAALKRAQVYARIKKCKWCGAAFISRSHRGMYCSNACKIKASRNQIYASENKYAIS